MSDLTFEQLMELCAIILVLVAAYNAIMTAIRNHREAKRIANSPIAKLGERIDRHDELLAKDKSRLDAHDAKLSVLGEESRIMLRGVRALLSHEINGNSIDRLKDSAGEIDEYLITRK